jgi:hypothetical protein
MVFTRAWGYLVNNLITVPWFIVILFTFFTKHMTNIIEVISFELIVIHLLGHFLFPE